MCHASTIFVQLYVGRIDENDIERKPRVVEGIQIGGGGGGGGEGKIRKEK